MCVGGGVVAWVDACVHMHVHNYVCVCVCVCQAQSKLIFIGQAEIPSIILY